MTKKVLGLTQTLLIYKKASLCPASGKGHLGPSPLWMWGQGPPGRLSLSHSPGSLSYWLELALLVALLARLAGQQAARIHLCLCGQLPIPCQSYSHRAAREASVWCWPTRLHPTFCSEIDLFLKTVLPRTESRGTHTHG